MNFRKGSKRQLTPTPRPSEWSLSLEIIYACISYYLALVPPCIYSTISIIKHLQHNFPKMRRGVEGRLEFFPKIHLILVQPSFPK